VKAGGIYGLIILSLSIITSYSVIAGVSDDENRIWVIIGNRSIYGSLFYEALDIHEYFLLYILPLEVDIFLDKSREEWWILSKPRNKSINIIDEAEESSYFRNITWDWPVQDLLNLGSYYFHSIRGDDISEELNFLCEQWWFLDRYDDIYFVKYLENKTGIDFVFFHRIGENRDIVGINVVNLTDIPPEYPVHESLPYGNSII
jgi:hypothetical protein